MNNTVGENHINRAFIELKICLQRPPILIYPDASKPYHLFTDTSKYCWEAAM